MITRRGVGFLLATIAIFFLAGATRVGWVYIADALLWGVLVLSAVFPHLTVPRVRASRRLLAPRRRGGDLGPVEGDTVAIELRLGNHTGWPRFFVSAAQESSLAGPGKERQRFFFARLAARTVSAAVGTVECHRRGLHRFGPVVVESRAPFGLFRRRRRLEAPLSVLVYPRWFEMRNVGLLGARRGDSTGRRKAQHGDEVTGSRRYVIGDSLRDIHWKNTARVGKPAVKEYDAGVEDALVIAFDTAAVYGDGRDTTLEYAITLAASVGRVVCARGGDVRLASDGRLSEPIRDWPELMRRLAVIEQSLDSPLALTLRNVPTAMRTLGIVAARDRAGAAALALLARRGVSVAAVVLEGFDSGADGFGTVRALERSGIAAIACRRGAIEQAVSLMEQGRTRAAIGRAPGLKAAA